LTNFAVHVILYIQSHRRKTKAVEMATLHQRRATVIEATDINSDGGDASH